MVTVQQRIDYLNDQLENADIDHSEDQIDDMLGEVGDLEREPADAEWNGPEATPDQIMDVEAWLAAQPDADEEGDSDVE